MSPSPPLSTVVVHPLVLLGVVDHYNRVCKDSKKRAIGILLGTSNKGIVQCTNSFAVPFEEDERDSSVWFLDHNYLENMYEMFRKVNAREVVVGWYSSGPKIRPADLDIHGLLHNYASAPCLVVIDVKPKQIGLPTEAYCAVEVPSATATLDRAFVHVASEISAADAEEVGVGHLLRDIKDGSVSDLTREVAARVGGLRTLKAKLGELAGYMGEVAAGRMPVNNEVMYRMQDVFNLLPRLDVRELVRAFAVKTNDVTMVLYVASLIRTITVLHNLIENKIELKQKEAKPAEEKEKEKEKNGEAEKENTEKVNGKKGGSEVKKEKKDK